MKEVNSLANTVQTIKRVRQTAVKSDRNTAQISRMRRAIKNFKLAVESGEGNQADLFKAAVKQIENSANKGLIHANKAARDISKLAKLNK
ncbi:30S ribosomal protein S20 [Ignavigranum ruoffiae]|nr:30S ribosomal protein S20 [Ignavigranum ruoffiae]UPQ85397.2 30S ribosomal protein S20 [Ignavigranum ruoffiae]